MITEVKPTIQQWSSCPYCNSVLKPTSILWQGMHICVESICSKCTTEIIDELNVGHANNYSLQVDLTNQTLFGNDNVAKKDLGEPLLKSLLKPQFYETEIAKEVFHEYKRVIILNCVDFLYGHSLLKLLNAQRHLEQRANYGLVVIVPKFLRWMVPEGIAEVWTADISLKNGQLYYPNFHQFVCEQLNRFDEVYVSQAYSHPSQFDISLFTKISKHNFDSEDFKVTFIWREDRLWCNFLLSRVLRKLKLTEVALFLQNRKVRKLFEMIREKLPSAQFTVVGLGQKTSFQKWIEDYRVDKFDEKKEQEVCLIYSQSRLVIGVHGSNMLLPSGHAGMTIDLMLEERWGNFAQDILYHESDPRLASFRYRYVPLQTRIAEIAHIASIMILGHSYFSKSMTADRSA